MRFYSSAPAIVLISLASTSFAAEYSQSEMAKMQERVSRSGSVPVNVVLSSMKGERILQDYSEFKRQTFSNAEKVIAELGDQAMQGGLRMNRGNLTFGAEHPVRNFG